MATPPVHGDKAMSNDPSNLTHEIIQGDSLREMREIDEGTYDGIIADPPYGISFDSGTRRKVLASFGVIQNDERPFVWWLYDAARILRVGGHLICFCRWDVAEAFKLAIGWAGLNLKSQIIWDRGNHGLGDLKGQFAPQHDIAWHATKGKGELYGKRPVSVIPAMRLSGEQLHHPNEKPVELMRYLVRAISRPGDYIFDPFAGSGSVGKACQLEGRGYLGIEIDQKYALYARSRLLTTQLTMDFGTEEDVAYSEPIDVGNDDGEDEVEPVEEEEPHDEPKKIYHHVENGPDPDVTVVGGPVMAPGTTLSVDLSNVFFPSATREHDPDFDRWIAANRDDSLDEEELSDDELRRAEMAVDALTDA